MKKLLKEKTFFGRTDKNEAILLSNALMKKYGLKIFPKDVKKNFKTDSSAVYYCAPETHEPLIIKKSFWHSGNSHQSLKKAYSLSEALRGCGAPLPKIFINKNGEYVTRHDSRSIVVLQYINGLPFSSRNKEFSSAGGSLGVLHRAGNQYETNHPREYNSIHRIIKPEKPYEESRAMYYESFRDDLIKFHHCGVREICETIRQNIETIDSAIKFIDNSGVNSANLSSGIVHNDLSYENIVFAKDGSTIALLDIDQIGVAPHVWDLGNTLASFVWKSITYSSNANIELKTKLLLKAYHKEYPLPLREYELVLAAAQRWDVMRILRSLRRHHYENNRLPRLLPKIKQRLVPRIKESSKIFSFLSKKWIERNIG